MEHKAAIHQKASEHWYIWDDPKSDVTPPVLSIVLVQVSWSNSDRVDHLENEEVESPIVRQAKAILREQYLASVRD